MSEGLPVSVSRTADAFPASVSASLLSEAPEIQDDRWWVSKLCDLPVFDVLKAVYKEDKQLLLSLLSINLLWPLAVDCLAPWWLSESGLMQTYVYLQNDVRQQLSLFVPVPGGGSAIALSYGLLLRAMAASLWHSLLKGSERFARQRLDLRMQLLIRRLVVSKVLFSEIGALENAYADILGTAPNTRALERRLYRDINDSIQIVLSRVPRMLSTTTHLSQTLHGFYVTLYRNYYAELKEMIDTENGTPKIIGVKIDEKMNEIALSERYRKRRLLHAFLIAHPFAFHLCREVVGALVLFESEMRMLNVGPALRRQMTKVVNDTVNGLREIQVMNYSSVQLAKLESLMAKYLHAQFGLSPFLQCLLEDFRTNHVWFFVVDCIVEFELRTRFGGATKLAQPIFADEANLPVNEMAIDSDAAAINAEMNDDSAENGFIQPLPFGPKDTFTGLRPVSHRSYLKLKYKCSTVFKDVEQLYRHGNFVRFNLDRQKYVKQVLEAPSFVENDALILKQRFGRELPPFESVRIERLFYSYSQKIPLPPSSTEPMPSALKMPSSVSSAESVAKSKKPSADGFALRISPQTPFVIESGKSYGICGRNESGKSTLVDILCKLRSAQLSQAAYNAELDFDAGVGKEEFRSQVSYVTQKPFLFEGSVGSNVHIGNPDATVDELRVACEKAGVFCGSLQKSSKKKKRRNYRRRSKGPRVGHFKCSNMVSDLVSAVFGETQTLKWTIPKQRTHCRRKAAQ